MYIYFKLITIDMKHYLFRLKTVLGIMNLQISNELKF